MPEEFEAPALHADAAARPDPVARRLTIALTVLAIGGAMGVAQLTRKQRRLQEYVAGRDVIAEQLDGLLYAPGVLAMAARQTDLAPGNRELAACLGLGGTCTVTEPTRQAPFAVRMALDPAAPLLVGTPEQPTRFGGAGKVGCDPEADDACPGWSAEAWFWADCPGGAAQCPKAERLHVRHLVRPLGELAGLPAAPSPEQLARDVTAFARTVEVAP